MTHGKQNPRKVIAVCGNKGGGGKSTLCLALAGELRARLIDADAPQHSIAAWVDQRAADVERGRRMQSHPLLEAEDSPYVGWPVDLAANPRELQAAVAQDSAGVVVIDTPGAVDAIADAALKMADLALVVARPNPLDFAALMGQVEGFRKAAKAFRIVLCQVPAYERAAVSDIRKDLRRSYGAESLPACLGFRADFARAVVGGKFVGEYRAGGAAAYECRAVARAVRAIL